MTGLSTYLGIWTNEDYLVIATLISGHTISYEYSLNKNIYTECDIKKFLESNNCVEVISKSTFEENLNNAISILKI